MAGYRNSFEGNLDYAYTRGVTDMTSSIQRNVSQMYNLVNATSRARKQFRQTKNEAANLSTEIRHVSQALAFATNPNQITQLTLKLNRLNNQFKKAREILRKMPFEMLQNGIGRVVGGLGAMNMAILGLNFRFLTDSIKRVYELQERWTRAIGGFNMQLGGMTSGLRGAQRAATAWSSTIRGLTNGDINEGIQMFTEFTTAIGRVVERGDQFQKFGLQLARGFNLGGSAAGQLTKVFQNIGDNGADATRVMGALVKGANLARIPTNLLAKDIADSSVYMARFGKEGQRTFVTGAAYVRKYTISIEQLKSSVEGLDMFDEAARTASKLNVAFGTMINSMDLMLEDDPAARLEMIRQQFLAQGTTFDRLTPKQRRYLSESLKLTEDQVAALLDASRAGESYADFQQRAARREKGELDAKRMMEKQLRATAQTMYAFGVAFDRITIAIGNAIRPLLQVFGLARDGDKQFTSFGQVMESITRTVEEFFNSLAKNERWNSFMRTLAHDITRVGRSLREFVFSGGAADLIGDIAKTMKSFYMTIRDLGQRAAPAMRPLLDVFLLLSQHIKELAVAWAGLKIFNSFGGPDAFWKAFGGMSPMSTLKNAGQAVGKGAGKIGNALGGVAGIGSAASSFVLGQQLGGTGTGVGAGIGSLIGSTALAPFLGPALGPIVGSFVGGLLGNIATKIFSGGQNDKLSSAKRELEKQTSRERDNVLSLNAQLELSRRLNDAEDRSRRAKNVILENLEKQAISAKEKSVTLSAYEAEVLRSRSAELSQFSKRGNETEMMLRSLGEGSKLTKNQLKDLMHAGQLYEKTLSDLRSTSEQVLKQELAKLESSRLGSEKAGLETIVGLNESFIDAGRKALKAMGQGDVARKAFGSSFEFGAGIDDVLDLRERRRELEQRFADAGQVLDRSDPDYLAAKAAEKSFNEIRARLSKKEQQSLDLTLDIRKRELENVKLQQRLATLQTDFIRQQTVIQLRAVEMGSGRFMTFMNQHPEIKSSAEAFNAYLEASKADLTGLYGASGYELLKSTPNFGIPKMAKGGVVNRPTVVMAGEAGPEAIVPLSRYNFASPGPTAGGGSQNVVSTVAEVQLDGIRVGRALVRSVITGRD